MHANQTRWHLRTLLMMSACVLCQVGWTQDPDQNIGGNRPMAVEQVDPNAQPLRQRTLPATRPSDEATQPATEPQSSLSEVGLQAVPAGGDGQPASEPRRLVNSTNRSIPLRGKAGTNQPRSNDPAQAQPKVTPRKNWFDWSSSAEPASTADSSTNKSAGVSSRGDNDQMLWISFTIGLGLITALFMLYARRQSAAGFFSKWNKPAPAMVGLLHRVPIDQRQSLALVRFGNKIVLVGCTGQNMQPLAECSGSEADKLFAWLGYSVDAVRSPAAPLPAPQPSPVSKPKSNSFQDTWNELAQSANVLGGVSKSNPEVVPNVTAPPAANNKSFAGLDASMQTFLTNLNRQKDRAGTIR